MLQPEIWQANAGFCEGARLYFILFLIQMLYILWVFLIKKLSNLFLLDLR